MFKKYFLLPAWLFCTVSSLAGTEPQHVPSTLKTVTVYRNGAEMQHHANVQLAQGANELIVENISNNIDLNSIQVNCPDAITIMSVEFSNNFLLPPAANGRIQLLKDSLEKVEKEIEKNNSQINILNDLVTVLKANKDIKGAQNGLSVAELAKLMDYYRNKSLELQQELIIQQDKQKKWNELRNRLISQMQEEEKKNTRKSGQITLQLNVAAAGKYEFAVSYITPNAYWTPYYDIRVDDIKNPLKVIYKSKIVQTTGIDWKKVKLSLSTSVPNQWGNAPVVRSWFLSYINPVTAMEKRLAGKLAGVDVQNDEVNSLSEVVVTGYGIRGASAVETEAIKEPLYIVNGAVMSKEEFSKINRISIKSTEVLKSAAATALYGSRAEGGAVLVTLKEGMSDYVSVTDNELNVTFDIELPYDVATNGKEQAIVLKEYTAGSVYKFYSAPRLDKDTYLLADITDWEKLNLLPGNANIILEGTYVGKSFIDPNAISDTLNLTLGRDKRVVVKKEKLVDYSSVKFLGSNKLQKFTYEISVKNNKKDKISLLLKDQYPLPSLKEIEVDLLETGNASVDKELGILSWNMELAPGENKKIRFAYSVRYPKDRLLNLN
ncbi:MAG: mucoidy inhibitor MuiA family protein [Chitinophagaceae bacterium]|nr:mucoidy inhibitor MuiA family protein [Chitinophagaceae bacterium]